MEVLGNFLRGGFIVDLGLLWIWVSADWVLSCVLLFRLCVCYD
jgi:hypothetical protein